MYNILFSVVALLTPLAHSAMFSDVPTDYPYRAAIEELRRQEVFLGYPDGRFFPFQTITRIELLHTLVKALHTKEQIAACNTSEIEPFTDVDYNAWYGNTLCLAQATNLVTGYNTGEFKPEHAVNFAEAATFLARNYEVLRTSHHSTPDTVWYKPYVKDLSVLKAIPLTITSPDAFVSRGEIAEMMFRIQNFKSYGSVGNVQYLTFEEMNTTGQWITYTDPLKRFEFKYPNNWPEPYLLNGPQYTAEKPAVDSLWELHIGTELPCKGRTRCIERTHKFMRFSTDRLDGIAAELDHPSVTIISDVANETRNMLIFEEKTATCTHRTALFRGRNYLYALFSECAGTLSSRARTQQRIIESLQIDEARQRL